MKMKTLVFLFVIVSLLAACKTKGPHYIIKARIAGADSVTFFLQKRISGKYVKLDSAMVIKGEFTMTGGKVDYPEMVFLLSKDRRKGTSFFLENTEITITGTFDSLYNAKVSGSKSQDEINSYKASLELVNKRYSDLDGIYSEAEKAGNKAKTDSLNKVFESLQKEIVTISKDFVKSHPASFASPAIIKDLSYELEPADLEAMIGSLDSSVARTQTVKDLTEHIAVMKTVAIGQKAPDFTLNDPEDKAVPLYSKVGKTKLLLVDFWASWCGPCRQENPNVVKVWKEFNKKGFDVFSVSLDRPGAKEDWTGAIKKDQLTWTHVSDLKYWDCSAAKLYAVNAIPSNFLLNDKGIIIAKNLRGDELATRVKVELAK